MLFGRTKTNSIKLTTQQLGTGEFGAKTTELARFKDIVEKHGICIPPHISLPREFFHPMLIREGVLSEDGKLLEGDTTKYTYNAGELEILKYIFSQFKGHPLAIRSDEQTAKGVGVFHTKFIMPSDKNFENNILDLNGVVDYQFHDVVNAFKRRLGLPHGIGIQFMPLVGAEMNGCCFPTISLAGFTATEHGKIVLYAGSGIGGGVSKKAERAKLSVEWKGELLSMPTDPRCWRAWDYAEGRVMPVALPDVPKYHDFFIGDKLERKITDFIARITAVAKDSGTDVYFEAQCGELSEPWYLTQISGHVWPPIERPAGTNVYLVQGLENVIGSKILTCTGFVREPGENEKKALAKRQDKGSLLYVNFSDLVEIRFENFSQYAAVCDLHIHNNKFSSHVPGAYREAGMIVFGGTPMFGTANETYDYLREILSRVDSFVVWADELNNRGGIVVP